MPRLVGVALVVAALVFGGAGAPRAAGDDDTAANRLLVEAVGLVERAEATESPGDRAALYERALDNLDEIVAQFPGTDAATLLATGQPVREIDRRAIERQRWFSIADDCIAESDRLCLLDVALEIFQADETGDDRYPWALAVISAAQADAGAFEQARETANAIADLAYQAWAFGAVARFLARARTSAESQVVFLRAVRAANAVGDAYWRAWALGNVAAWQAEAGDVSGAHQNLHRAMELANEMKVKEPWTQALLLALFAEVQIKAGDSAEGRRTLAKAAARAWNVVQPLYRFHAVSTVVVALAKSGDVAGARENIERALESLNSFQLELDSILSGWSRDEALSGIIGAQARTGDVEAAIKNAANIGDPFRRALALARCAETQLEGDDVDGARRTTRLAFATIKELVRNLEIAMAIAYLGYGIVAQ